MERTERMAASVKPEVKREARVKAANQGLNMGEYVRKLIYEDLGRSEGENREARESDDG